MMPSWPVRVPSPAALWVLDFFSSCWSPTRAGGPKRLYFFDSAQLRFVLLATSPSLREHPLFVGLTRLMTSLSLTRNGSLPDCWAHWPCF